MKNSKRDGNCRSHQKIFHFDDTYNLEYIVKSGDIVPQILISTNFVKKGSKMHSLGNVKEC